MEHLLLPSEPTVPLAKVPYVCFERYDGLPFLGYAKRKGKLTLEPPPKDMTYIPMQSNDRRFPPPAAEQEPFFQTWLFFGLLSEFLGGNAEEESQTAQYTSNKTLDFLYANFLYEEDGQQYVTTARLLPIIDSALAESDAKMANIQGFKLQLKHLSVCIRYAASVIMSSSPSFDSNIKSSIAAMGESLMWITASRLSGLGMELDVFCVWTTGPFSRQMRAEMIQHGWCPSDISKCGNTMGSTQSRHLLSKINRSKPLRNHSKCTEQSCRAGQIDQSKYHVGHISQDCNCKTLTIHSNDLIKILEKEDLIPILKIYGGEIELSDMKVDVIESAASADYVAISHVWADGLGNPFANSLYRCQLAQLRDLAKDASSFISAKDDDAPIEDRVSVLLWLDTLCCPIGPENAKRMALEKIRNVYEGAAVVLVLDASLRSYAVAPMTPFEVLARIVTSGWTRRLWTLQEGALAKAILFQFSDQCIYLDTLLSELQKEYESHIYYRGVIADLKKEINLLRSFFYNQQYSVPLADFPVIDSALKHRSVSVASDEALCIATLMLLDIHTILAVEKEERMRVVWEQMFISKGSIPASIIFCTEPRLDIPSFRWAPASLLGFSESDMSPLARFGTWTSNRVEKITSLGLQARFCGIRISPQVYEDGLPRDPWVGSLKKQDGRPARLPEAFTYIRNKENQWFHVFTQDTATNGRLQTTEKGREWKADMEYPLYEMISTNRCAIILYRVPDSAFDSQKRSTAGLIVSCYNNGTKEMEQDEARETMPLFVRSEGHVIVTMAKPSELLIFSTIERLAMHLRGHKLTRELCAIPDKSGEEYDAKMNSLKETMKLLTKEALDADPELVDAVNSNYADFLNDVWKFIANWYRQDVALAEMLPDEQLWIVD